MHPGFTAVKTGSILFSFIVLLTICKTAMAGSIFSGCLVFHDSIMVRILQSKKPPVFELYPDVSQAVLLFTAKGEKGKLYQLFLFNIDGKLIRQTQIHSKETSLVAGLEKGDYLFEVLSNDDRIGNGNIAVR